MKRIIAILLCLCMAAAWLPMGTSAEKSEYATIEEQIRAFADSIDQASADDDAAWALAGHGISKNGKKLAVGKDHALTATLMNAELTQAGLTEILTEMIRLMQLQGMDVLYTSGGYNWGSDQYSYSACLYQQPPTDENAYFKMMSCPEYTGSTNAYDVSLEWMTGSNNLWITLERSEVGENTVFYDVRLTFGDRFDFDPGSAGSIPKDLAALLGSFLFDPFDWEAMVSFRLEVPNACTHLADNYHWTFDREQNILTSDPAEGFTDNPAQQMIQEHESGNRYYHKLEREVILRHDYPWVMVYSVKNPNKFAFSPVTNKDTKQSYFLNFHRDFLFFTRLSPDETEWYYYGTAMKRYFSYNTTDTYTIRLENVIDADGSNMIWVTVYNEDLQSTVLERTPMDDRYVIRNGSWIMEETEENGLSGMDFSFIYIGNLSYRFDPDTFEMTIWTGGQDEKNRSLFVNAVTAPSCEKQGYTTHTCTLCGYRYTDSYVDACHSWGEWEVISDTMQQRTCTVCGKAEQEEISFLYGDANGDGEISGLDMLLLRQFVAGWDVELDTTAADADGSGTVNALDMLLLRQYIAGWDVTLGP